MESRCASSARTSTSPSARRAEEALRKLNETLEQQVAERTRERDRLWRVSDDLIGVANFDGHWVGDQSGRDRDARLERGRAARACRSPTLWHPGRRRRRRSRIASS